MYILAKDIIENKKRREEKRSKYITTKDRLIII